MVVDLLADPHVYKNPTECEELLKTLRNNPTVAAYHLWADRFGKTRAPGGRATSTTSTSGTRRTPPTSEPIRAAASTILAKSDFISYYDFAWKRGPHKNFPNLLAAWNTAKANDNRLGRYCETDRRPAGQGQLQPHALHADHLHRLRLARGDVAHRLADHEHGRLQVQPAGKDLAAVNAWIEPMRAEIAKIGLPTAIYSTAWTKDWNNRPVQVPDGKPAMPPGLENSAFPADFWIQPVSGEFVMGVSKYNGTRTMWCSSPTTTPTPSRT